MLMAFQITFKLSHRVRDRPVVCTENLNPNIVVMKPAKDRV